MSRTKDDRLDDEAEHQEQTPLPQPTADECRPAIGTARNNASSQKPAWNEFATADNHGAYVASTSGCSSASDGDHHPSVLVVTRYSSTSYAKNTLTRR